MKFFIYVCVLFATLNPFHAFDGSNPECGMEGSASRVYKGKEVRAHKYPWLAHIRMFVDRSRPDEYSICGGALVDGKTILTAASCFSSGEKIVHKPENVDVYLGNGKVYTDTTKPTKFASIWIDPEFNPDPVAHDFAIITLAEPVNFTNTIAPICLPNTEHDIGIKQLMAAGWGKTDAYSESVSNTLLEAEVDYIPEDECTKMVGRKILESNDIPVNLLDRYLEKGLIKGGSDTHICAINRSTKSHTCSGDSGGPLMQKNSDGRWVLVGVVSGAIGECHPGEELTSLYTRTSYYVDTIKKTAKNAGWVDL